mgnify:CR=1 FL=1
MTKRFDENGYERYNDYPRELRGGMDEAPRYWDIDRMRPDRQQYEDCGMVLCEKTWTWVLPHQLEDDQ